MPGPTVSREPLHSIIASRAERRIRSGEWAAGTRLPPERELCELLDVSRTTLRQALAELEHRGLISRHQGRGTFVTRPRLDAAVTGHFTISAALQARGVSLETRVISAAVMPVPRSTADDLAMRPGDPVVHVERLRSIEGEPLMLESTDLPSALFPGLEALDLEHRSLYTVLADDYGRMVQTATESLEPVMVTTRESSLLEVPRHAPALLIRRVSSDQSGTLVELSNLVLRGDRSRFLLERRIRQAWPGAPTPDARTKDGPYEPVDAARDRIAASLLVDA